MTEVIAHDAGNLGCVCPACSMPLADPSDTVVPVIDGSLDTRAGEFQAGKPIFTAKQVAAYLNRTGGGFKDGTNDSGLEGRQNDIGDDNRVVTFGFFNTQAEVINNGYTYVAPNALGVPTRYGLDEVFNFAPMTTAQRAATREAMQAWDDVAAITMREVSANEADMNFGNLAVAATTQAYARIPTASLDTTLGGQVREIGGDSWISASQATNFQLDEGGYGLQTLLHEAGHGLGLSHPGAYNAAPGLTISYGVNAEYAQDTRAYSVMSYFNASSLGARHFDFNVSTTVFSGVPLIHDIAAIQRMYGPDMETRTGDTIYGFNSNAGRDSYDFTKTPAPIMAIWDAGGIDTIDASLYATRQVIDLTPGSLSSIGGVTFENAPSFEQVNANRVAAGMAPITKSTYDGNMALLASRPEVGELTDNVGIAYGAVIENAIGGSGADAIIGNSFDNVLSGNAGNDVIGGGAGNDTLDGGSGNDAMDGGLGDDRFVVDAAGDEVIEKTDEGSDTVVSAIDYALGDNLENLVLTGSAKIGTGNALGNAMTGNALANMLAGGAGNDVLKGEAGDDTLDGGTGDDQLLGGAGDDRYMIGAAGDVVTELANEGIDTVESVIDYSLGTNVENLVLAGSARNGTGNAVDNVVTGNELANILSGGSGNDRLVGGEGNDTLDGGTGNDQLLGGLGNDRYTVEAAGDIVTELAGEGTDIVFSAIDYALTDNVENLTLTSGAKIGTGNALNNLIVGNEVANSLAGGAGDDRLEGGAGKDTLSGGGGVDRLIGGDGYDFMSGGDGADAFVAEYFLPLNSVGRSGSFSGDTVLDFASGTDKIDLSGFGFGSIELTGIGANKDAGDISFRVFDSVRGAETALGYDIDGQDGTSTFAGPVTIVYINVDGNAPDIALSLIGASGVTANDFVFNGSTQPATAISPQFGTSPLMISELAFA